MSSYRSIEPKLRSVDLAQPRKPQNGELCRSFAHLAAKSAILLSRAYTRSTCMLCRKEVYAKRPYSCEY